jgi:hypothetical protein
MNEYLNTWIRCGRLGQLIITIIRKQLVKSPKSGTEGGTVESSSK